MSVNHRELLEKVRDLKLGKDDMPQLSNYDKADLMEEPIIIERSHLIAVLKRFKQERITEEIFSIGFTLFGFLITLRAQKRMLTVSLELLSS